MQNIITTIKSHYGRERTLQQGVTIGKTLWLTFGILMTFIFIGEVVARQKSFQDLFLAPGIGSSHRQFEIQLGRLDRIAQEEGRVDCFIIGSSAVQEGFNPIQFRSAFLEISGKDFNCYNFGVDGLTTTGASVISQVLVKLYNPKVLIYGTDPRDYTYPLDSWENNSITDSPWMQYQLGNGNFIGWLFEHSYFLMYQEPIHQSLNLQFKYELRRYRDWVETEHWGQNPILIARVNVSKPPNENSSTNYVRVYSELLSHFQVFTENLEALKEISALQRNGVHVFVVEMPIAPGYTDFFPNGSEDYEIYIDNVNEILTANQVPYLSPQSDISVPITGWTDYNHLNPEGTKLFSEWLGVKVAQLYIEEVRTPSVP